MTVVEPSGPGGEPAQRPDPGAEDSELVRRLRSGEEHAFAELVDRWSSSMLRVAVVQTSSRALAEEAVQDTWLAVLQGIDGFEGRSSLRTWVFRILHYTSRAKAVRERRVPALTEVAGGRGPDGAWPDGESFLSAEHPRWPGHWSQPPRAWAPVPDAAVLGTELRSQLGAAIASLPDRQRLVLTLRDADGCSPDEVCDLLDITPGNQRVLLHRARTAVRAALTPYLAQGPS